MTLRSTQAARPGAQRLLVAAVLGSSVLLALGACGKVSAPSATSHIATHGSAPVPAHTTGGLASCPAGGPGCNKPESPQLPPIGPAPSPASSVMPRCAARAPDPHNPMLTPLSSDDIQLYLTVMHAAADRVRHPTAADRAALEHQQQTEAAMNAVLPQREAAAEAAQASNAAAMKKIMAAVSKGDYAAAQATANAAKATHAGNAEHPPAALPEYAADADLAFNLRGGHADHVIVAERHLDADRYARIVDIIEYIVIPPQQDFIADGDGPIHATPCPPTARDRAIDDAEARQRQLLAPYRDEISALETVVRTPLQNHADSP